MRTASVVSAHLHRNFQGLFIKIKNNKNTKSYSTSFATREFEEIQFSVPWGHISGKWYGPKDKRPIVGIHGWQDNAGTFDTLAPLLPHHIGFLAIDLPGHGLSSWIPDGCSYHSMDYVKALFTLMREFKWDKISMIGHSMGAINGFIFSSLFPDKCDMLIALDGLKPVSRSEEKSINSLVEQFEADNKLVEISRRNTNPPCYEFEELVDRVHKGTGKSISKECCQFILQRNIKPSKEEPNKYFFSRDSRLKSIMFYMFPNTVVVEMARRIKCPHLSIRAQKTPRYDTKTNYEEVISVLNKNPAFENHLVNGTHHVHLNEPHKIADIVNPFISKYRQI